MSVRRQQILAASPAARRVGVGQARALPSPVARRNPAAAPRRPQQGPGRPGGQRAPSASPWDSSAEQGTSAALLNRENTRAGVRGARLYQQEQFGLDGSDNPYSHAAQLARERDIGNRANLNSAGLQLYSGSTINRARGVASAYDRGRQQLESEYASRQEEAKQGELDAEGTYQDALAKIREGALERALGRDPALGAVPPGRRLRRPPRRR